MKLDRNSDEPLYIQLYSQFATEIENGYRVPGDALPSRRVLCSELNISPSTVENAYGRLAADGYIISRPSSGYYVAPESVRESEQQTAASNIINFTSNGIETSKLPFDTWRKLMQKTLSGNPELLLHGEKHGEPCLKKSIRRMLFRTQGIECRTSQIIIGPGLDDLVRDIFLMLGFDYDILLNNYYNYRIKWVADCLHMMPKYIRSDRNGIVFEDLKNHMRGILYQKPTHDLPTGATLSNEQREQLVSWLGEGRYILEDTSENDYCYTRRKKTLWELSGGRNVILLGNFSNTIAPAMKIGYAVLPDDLVLLWDKSKRFYSNRVSRAEQVTLSKFIDRGFYEQHVGYMRSIFREKAAALTKAIENSSLAPYTTLYGCDAGTFCTAEFNLDTDPETAFNQLPPHEVKAVRINDTLGNPEYKIYDDTAYVLGFGNLKISQIYEGISRLEQAWL